MSLTLRFLLRMAGVVLIAVAFAALYLRDSWGANGLWALSWAALWASVMGVIGFRSLSRAMGSSSSELMAITMKGMLLRAVILAASQAVVFELYGNEWGGRTLMATVSLYMLVLGTEVYTLHQAMKSGVWQKSAAEAEAPPGPPNDKDGVGAPPADATGSPERAANEPRKTNEGSAGE